MTAASKLRESFAYPSSISFFDNLRTICELARLHDPFLTLLAWYPTVWALCLARHTQGNSINAPEFFSLAIKNYIVVALTHSACCTMNDILDRNFDPQVPRTASRPIPSGRVSIHGAILSFFGWAIITVITTYHLEGEHSLCSWLPSWILSLIYPLAKRWVNFPQLVLGSAVACVVIPSWIQGEGSVVGKGILIPIVLFIILWIIYIDTLYASMDSAHDTAAGVKSLAVTLKPHINFYLSLLACAQIACLSTLAIRTRLSPLFWVLGVGIWAANNIWHIHGLRIIDGNWAAGSGGVIFKRNIGLGAWLCAVEILELWYVGLLNF